MEQTRPNSCVENNLQCDAYCKPIAEANCDAWSEEPLDRKINISSDPLCEHTHHEQTHSTSVSASQTLYTDVDIKGEPLGIKTEPDIHDEHQDTTDVHTDYAVYECDGIIDVEVKPLLIKVESIEPTEDEQPRQHCNVTATSNDDVKSYECYTCHQSFKLKYNLKTHFRKHTGEEPFKCNVCNQSFKWMNAYKTHMQTHVNDKSHECKICRKEFSRKSTLTQHMRTHTGEKPYACNICHKRFFFTKQLTVHLYTHTGVKPYKCNICHNGFNRNVHLRMHMRTHTGEKPFKCSVCQKKFSWKYGLTSHMRKHTGEEPFECTICHQRFKWMNMMKTHVKSHEAEKSLPV